jgi:hypothetical protein
MFTIGKLIHSFVKSQRCSYGLSAYPELQEFLRASPEMSALLSSLTEIEHLDESENRREPVVLSLIKKQDLNSASNSSQLSSYSGEDAFLFSLDEKVWRRVFFFKKVLVRFCFKLCFGVHFSHFQTATSSGSSIRISSPRLPKSIKLFNGMIPFQFLI